jgi:hypothetical protein
LSVLQQIKQSSSKISVTATIIVILVVISLRNYLLFHTTVELFSILVGFGIAAIAVHTNKVTNENDNLLSFIGVAYFFIALFDLLHTMAFEGMGIFPGSTANLATQLWIIPRYMEALTFLAVPYLVINPQRKTKLHFIFPAVSLIQPLPMNYVHRLLLLWLSLNYSSTKFRAQLTVSNGKTY